MMVNSVALSYRAMTQTVAIIEDETALAKNYQAALERVGYQVQLYVDRDSARAAFARSLPDLAIIDIQLGDDRDGGHELCRYLRSCSDILPIVFLTARDSEIDVIVGLKLGADEYLTKGISMDQLTTRVDTLLRRHAALLAAADKPDVLERGDLRLDRDCMTASWKETPLAFTLSEFLIVECLARKPGQVKSRQQLMDAVDKVIAEESINSYIKRIRLKLRSVDAAANPVRSEHSLGYRWVLTAE